MDPKSRDGASEQVPPDWRGQNLPRGVTAPVTLLLREELQMLYWLSLNHFGNWGHIVDAGCFLGDSTVALGSGVLRNKAFLSVPRNRIVHSYDRFQVEDFTIGRFFAADTPPKSSFEMVFRRNIAAIANLVEVNPGDICDYPPFQEPIEILFIDIAKHWITSDHLVTNFFPALVPGRSLVIQQDYLFGSYSGWLHATMEFFCEYFEIVDHTGRNSVLFRYVKQIPDHLMGMNVFQSLSQTEILALLERAAERFGGEQRAFLDASREQLMGILQTVRWPR